MDCGTLSKVKDYPNDVGLALHGKINLARRINGTLFFSDNPRKKAKDAKPNTPDYIVRFRPEGWRCDPYTVGSGWLMNTDDAGDFISFSMDDPQWDRPVYLAAFATEDKPGVFTVVWTRPKGAKVQDKSGNGAPALDDEIPY